ncbi:acetolactate synthase large subunit [Natranaerovirga pectinivora]|uniref:Acetolactate synthase n=1 Tax=Natranaerovirga pectinivora TaxID=682400 RepID=A0A4R3MKB5_9FIRM|nr:biosynthetic-type acetolactate synthase large subunit [Natranaerovirga pectinivora]TCT13846.1 acetolactate synthase large subunit [Natranaerovirga pectinivora]
MEITGAKLLLEALKKEGVDTLFGYPGGYVISIFDALYSEPAINLILPRHEQALIHAADGYARATGKVGVCLVTSGPGATNTITGLATAYYDSIPLICITGQVPTSMIGTDAFQEADIFNITRSVCKHNYYVTKREDLGRIIKEAFYIATTGRPGPVVIDLPGDIQKELGSALYPETITVDGYCDKPELDENLILDATALINSSNKPLFLIGGGMQNQDCANSFLELVNKTNIPVISTLMGLGVYPEKSPHNLGMVGMHGSLAANHAISNCDLLIAIGTRFTDRVTSKIETFAKDAKIIHIDIDESEINKRVMCNISINGDAHQTLSLLLKQNYSLNIESWLNEVVDLKKKTTILNDEYNPRAILKKIASHYEDAVVSTDVGQHQMHTAQNYPFNTPNTLLTSGGMGTMGFGLPAAIGASIGLPNKRVISISGDGGFQMNLQELALVAQLELPMIIIIFNNQYLGMVRQWQQILFNKNYSSTCLRKKKNCPKLCNTPGPNCPEYSPNFIKLADAYNIPGYRVSNMAELEETLEISQQKNTPILIEVLLEPEINVLPMVPSGASLNEMITEF